MAANALQGLCPECMMSVGLMQQTGEAEPGEKSVAEGPRKVVPAIAGIAALFPQLQILEHLGSGGMGAVYKARQPRLDRLVALKILTPHLAPESRDSRFAERFEREARALAKLNHPSIVAVYEFGEAGGLPYLIMEYVDGLNLRQLERAGKLSPQEALKIVPQICVALQFAHDAGVVHRDIKPENILLDQKGQVKVADFGIAKILGRDDGTATLTQHQEVVGTPHYMAPEQVERPAAVDHRADIYSLGVVLYEMLTGELPLGKFAPPSSRVRGIQVDVRLDEVVMRALEKEPERRYQNVSRFKTDVETIATGPVLPARRSRAARLSWAAAALVLGVAVLAWLLVFRTGSYRAASAMTGNTTAAGAEDVAHITAEEKLANGNPRQKYFLMAAKSGTAPATGHGLLLVLPGGDGGPDFLPFVKRVYSKAVPDDFLVAELIAPRWDDQQAEQIVWPTETSPYAGMEFSTEKFIHAVIAEVEKQHRLDARRLFTLSWSSGGPAAYAASLYPETRIAGSFIAMSVFQPHRLPDLQEARGHAYFLLHSPDDTLIPLASVNRARERLVEHGAQATLLTYDGGHGWRGDVYGNIRAGINWLEQRANTEPSAKETIK